MRKIIKNGKQIGTLDEVRKVFTKKVKGSIHRFRKLDAWGIDADVFNNGLLPENYIVRVYDSEDGLFYESTAENIKNNGQYFHFKDGEKDHNAQIFLPLKFWIKK